MTWHATVDHDYPDLEDLAFALSQELGRDPYRQSRSRLEQLARELDRTGDPLADLQGLCHLVADEFASDDAGPLLLPEVILHHHGHPDAIAVAALAIAERAELPVGLISDGESLYLAHETEQSMPFIIDFSRRADLISAATLGVDLHWMCPHEATFLVLRRIGARAEWCGDLALAIKVAAMGLALPLADSARRTHERHHRQLQARLN